MIPFPFLVVLWLARTPAVTASAPGAGSRLILRDGTVYLLKAPPRISGTRVVFTTVEGKTFSLDESEIASIGAAPGPTPVVERHNRQESTELGAIARQQRDARGKRAEVAPRAEARKKTPVPRKATRSPRPRPTPRAAPGNGGGPRG